jgi:hypothetical protein
MLPRFTRGGNAATAEWLERIHPLIITPKGPNPTITSNQDQPKTDLSPEHRTGFLVGFARGPEG